VGKRGAFQAWIDVADASHQRTHFIESPTLRAAQVGGSRMVTTNDAVRQLPMWITRASPRSIHFRCPGSNLPGGATLPHGFGWKDFPRAQDISARVLSLPVYSSAG
jgi:hypothetical protein